VVIMMYLPYVVIQVIKRPIGDRSCCKLPRRFIDISGVAGILPL